MLGTCFIPAGTRIILSMQGVHHRADLWPEPKQFRAERFLPGTEIDTYSFLPFIQGPRNCLGQYLALLEARVVLGVLSQVRPAQLRAQLPRRALTRVIRAHAALQVPPGLRGHGPHRLQNDPHWPRGRHEDAHRMSGGGGCGGGAHVGMRASGGAVIYKDALSMTASSPDELAIACQAARVKPPFGMTKLRVYPAARAS